MTRFLPLLIFAASITACGANAAAPPVQSGPLVHLPADQAAHPRVADEWWYVVGHLHSGTRTFGFEATAFRFSHVHVPGGSPGMPPVTLYRTDVAITDETGNQFHQKVTYYFPQSASLSGSALNVHVGSLRLRGSSPRSMKLGANLPGGSFALHLASRKPVMNVGGRGYLKFGSGYTYYYSLTDLATSGTLRLGSKTFTVSGISWLDHQWGTWSWASTSGWTWMAIQLDNGRQFSLFDVGTSAGRMRGVSLLQPNGKTTMLKTLSITPITTWQSPHTLGDYPSGWVVRIPGARATLRIVPTVSDQELVAPSQPQGSYWEGSGRVQGTFMGRQVSGKSYTELTGYAKVSK